MTTGGLICGIVTGITMGGFVGMVCSNLCEKLWSKIIIVIVSVAVFFCIAGFGFSGQEIAFNNGTCPQCNTKYVAVQHKNSDTYYECPNCYFGTWY